MKKLFAAVAVGALFCLASVAALAQNNPLISVDENGNGSLLFPGGMPIPTAGVLAPDPGPGGGPATLTYNLLGPPGLTAGDLLVLDPITFALSDIIRFNPAGTAPGYPASLVFYSLDNMIGALADKPAPTSLYANNIARFENAFGLTVFTPMAGDPGFVPGFSATYRIQSFGPANTPEFGSFFSLGGLLAAGGAGLWIRRRRGGKANAETK